jgi:hypothetical protein
MSHSSQLPGQSISQAKYLIKVSEVKGIDNGKCGHLTDHLSAQQE